MRRIYFVLFVLLVGCSTAAVTTIPGAWEDAQLVERQRAELEQQRRTLADMERVVGEVCADLGSARDDVEASINYAESIREQFEAIDRFVRSVVDAEQKLELLLRSNSGADAGAGRGPSTDISGNGQAGSEE